MSISPKFNAPLTYGKLKRILQAIMTYYLSLETISKEKTSLDAVGYLKTSAEGRCWNVTDLTITLVGSEFSSSLLWWAIPQ